jgi:hypothetical protein
MQQVIQRWKFHVSIHMETETPGGDKDFYAAMGGGLTNTEPTPTRISKVIVTPELVGEYRGGDARWNYFLKKTPWVSTIEQKTKTILATKIAHDGEKPVFSFNGLFLKENLRDCLIIETTENPIRYCEPNGEDTITYLAKRVEQAVLDGHKGNPEVVLWEIGGEVRILDPLSTVSFQMDADGDLDVTVNKVDGLRFGKELL